ncbi:hypothetical protein O0L34_g14057 [Tuta absoluta]|nr:hypothetical protein O0L34_g14057 [Tuta absoluta]
MTVETVSNVTKTFRFSYPTCTNENMLFKLEVPVEIPHEGSTRELVQRLLNMFRIPVYLEEELNEKLAEFVAEETKSFHNERDAKLLDQLKGSEIDVDGIVKGWEKQYRENVVDFAEQIGTSDEEVFAAAYHRLVHSPALDTILQVEASYARTTRNTLQSRDHDIATLTQRQAKEMEEAMRVSSAAQEEHAEDAVTALAAAHLEQQALAAGRWGSQLDALQHAQRAAHRAWLMQTLDHHTAATAEPQLIHTPSDSPLGSFPEGPLGDISTLSSALLEPAASSRLEESFTIHLGSQLKQTHNIRIAAMDLLDLCTSEDFDNPTETSRRLQTSVGLYGSELSAVVLLCESGPARPAGATARLLGAAAGSTEHHFQHADTQMRAVADRVAQPVMKRNLERLKSSDGTTTRSRSNSLQCGDVFLTRHSNLPDVHLVFHLVVDDTLKSGDITSRHPAILGLRNILKAACSNDVTSIALPLLLTHEHTEEMTVAWCVRRAELVLKCVKGFMVEAAGAGGAELRTLTAAAPHNTAPLLFHHLAQLTPNIFR